MKKKPHTRKDKNAKREASRKEIRKMIGILGTNGAMLKSLMAEKKREREL